MSDASSSNDIIYSDQITCHGQCHCGTIRFEVTIPRSIKIFKCNCSICSMSGFLSLIILKENFKLITGDEYLKSYRFGTLTANHKFCSICGIKSFYIPRSHAKDHISINLSCLNTELIENIIYQEFDGEHWEENIKKLDNF